jgi:2-haloacid dehalogenase
MNIKNIIFDFGGVLVDWNPRYLYKEHFATEAEMEDFLENICTDAWNIEQDRGRPLAEATKLLQEKHLEYHDLIALFYGEWETMMKDQIPGTVKILHEVRPKYNLYGLTNWSSETIDFAYNRFDFFEQFDGIVVSGVEKLIKPDHTFFHLLLNRYHIKAKESVFIDDNAANIKAAKEIGFHTVHFKSAEQLREELEGMGIL